MNLLSIALATALLALAISRLHFHFHFLLEVSRRAGLDTQRSKRGSRRPVDLGGGTPAAAHKGGDATAADAIRPTAMAPAGNVIAPAGVRSIADPGVKKAVRQAIGQAEADIFSALRNLGVPRQLAQHIARDAMAQGNNFDSRLKWALQKAA